MASTKRVAVYCRVSTTDQHAENQLAELREHAKRMGWETTEFVDEGHSGRKVSRPAFDQMMQAVRRHHYDVVCVWRLDRLSRGLRHAVNVLGELKDLSVEFISLRDGLNFGGPLGLALYALVAALAEAEVEALRERTRAGIAAARRRGKRIGRPPLGAASVEQMRELQRRGLRQHQIAERLGVSRAYVSRTLNPPTVRKSAS
ncbi:MAG: recombinase family protein [Planctomycetota bacterium]|nr:recombinase family protein [Planctomycetota bacterium]